MKTNIKNSIIALLLAGALAIPFAMAANEPDNVNNLKIVSKDATTLTLTWDAAKDYKKNDVDHYRIYYGTKSVQKGEATSYDVQVDTPDSKTTYDLTKLTTNTKYYASVTAVDAAKVESAEYSIEASGTPTATTPSGTDTTAPTVANVMAPDKDHVLVGFSEAVKLPQLLAEAAFTITEQINPANILTVKSAKLYDQDPSNKTVILETADQTKGTNYIMTASVAITDLAGNPIVSGSTDSGIFTGSDVVPASTTTPPAATTPPATTEKPAAETTPPATTPPATITPPADTTPPEDITNLVLTFTQQLKKFVIIMNWTASLNTAKDLVDQILYQSMDRGVTYDHGSSLGPAVTTHQIPNLEGGKEYTFKITTKDASGNESVGVVKSIRLPQTGAGVGLLVFGSAAMAYQALKRKKRAKKDVF